MSDYRDPHDLLDEYLPTAVTQAQCEMIRDELRDIDRDNENGALLDLALEDDQDARLDLLDRMLMRREQSASAHRRFVEHLRTVVG